MPFRVRNCGRIFYGGGSFRSGVQPPTGTILTAPTLDRRPPTAPGPPSTILAPHSFTVRPSRTLLIANKRIQSRTLIKQITSPQMLKQPPTRKSVRSRRIQNTKCPRLIQPQTNLPLHPPSESITQNPVLIHKIPRPQNTQPPNLPTRLLRTRATLPNPIHPTNASIPCLIQNLPRPANQIHANIRPPVQNLPRFAIHKINASPRPRIKKPFRTQPSANINTRRLTTRPRPHIRRFTNTNIRFRNQPRRPCAINKIHATAPVKKLRRTQPTANINARRLTIFRRPHMRRDARALIILIPHRQPNANSQRTTNLSCRIKKLRKPTANIRAWRLTLSRCCVKNLRRRASGTIKPVVSWRSKPNLATTTKTPLLIRANRIRPARIRRCRALIHIPEPNPHANLIPPACRNRATPSARPRAIPCPNPNRPPSKSPCLKNHRNPMQNRPPNRRLRPPDTRQNRTPGPCRKVNRRPRQPRHYRNRRIPNQNLPCQNPRTLPCPRVKVRRKTNIATPEPPPFPTRNIPPRIRPRRKNNRRPSPPPPRQPSKPSSPPQHSPSAFQIQLPDSLPKQP